MPKLIEKDQDFWHFVFSLIFISLVVLLTYYLEITDKIRYNISAFDSFILILAGAGTFIQITIWKIGLENGK